tara:strand:+ start:2874 stop:3074 length:201 start_codon:yes stop_codon:yes gene_type:complete
MAIISKGGINIIDKKAYVHPLTLDDIEFLLKFLGQSEIKGYDIEKTLEVAQKLQDEYNFIKKHIKT